jgi:hypothetical protein
MENLDLIRRYFPDWKVFVYVGADITEERIQSIVSYPRVILRKTGKLGASNMIDRFFAIDEPGVDIMFVRDADSRVHWKDRWAIQQFVKSDKVLHIIRDHEEHTSPILGGLWGLRKVSGFSMRDEYAKYIEDTSLGHRWAHDQNFLADIVYPRFLSHSLVHYSHRRIFKGENNTVPFPFDWINDIYCGRIEQPAFREPPIPHEKPLSFLPNVVVKLSR